MERLTLNSGNKLELVYLPKSVKDLYKLFAAHGLRINVIKWSGKYSLIYTSDNGEFSQVNTNCRRVNDMTLKGWLDFGYKNMPKFSVIGYKCDYYSSYIRAIKLSVL